MDQSPLGDLRVLEHDIGEVGALRDCIRESDVIFNLAGEINHMQSMQFPQRDAELKVTAPPCTSFAAAV